MPYIVREITPLLILLAVWMNLVGIASGGLSGPREYPFHQRGHCNGYRGYARLSFHAGGRTFARPRSTIVTNNRRSLVLIYSRCNPREHNRLGLVFTVSGKREREIGRGC